MEKELVKTDLYDFIFNKVKEIDLGLSDDDIKDDDVFSDFMADLDKSKYKEHELMFLYTWVFIVNRYAGTPNKVEITVSEWKRVRMIDGEKILL